MTKQKQNKTRGEKKSQTESKRKIIILLLITKFISEPMTISAHPGCKAGVYQVMLARDSKNQVCLLTHWTGNKTGSPANCWKWMPPPPHLMISLKGKQESCWTGSSFLFPCWTPTPDSQPGRRLQVFTHSQPTCCIRHCQERALTLHCSLRIHGLEERRSSTFLIS